MSDQCKDILSNGIFDEFRYENYSHFYKDLKTIFIHNYSELRTKKYDKDTSISLLILKLLNLGANRSQSKKEYETLQHFFYKASEKEFYARLSVIVEQKIVSPVIVNAWKECMRHRPKGATINILKGDTGTWENPNVDFLARITYIPTTASYPQVIEITSYSILGAEFIGNQFLNAGAVIPAFTSLTQSFRRTGRGGIVIAVNFTDREIPPCEVDPIEPPPPKPISVRKKVNAIGVWPLVHGDTNVDTNSRDRVPVKAKTNLTWSPREIELSVFFKVKEYRGDGTEYRGTKKYGIYKAPPGFRIKEVQYSGTASLDFDSQTVGQNWKLNPFNTSGTYWEFLKFRVDTREHNDAPSVGVTGVLNTTVHLEKE